MHVPQKLNTPMLTFLYTDRTGSEILIIIALPHHEQITDRTYTHLNTEPSTSELRRLSRFQIRFQNWSFYELEVEL